MQNEMTNELDLVGAEALDLVLPAEVVGGVKSFMKRAIAEANKRVAAALTDGAAAASGFNQATVGGMPCCCACFCILFTFAPLLQGSVADLVKAIHKEELRVHVAIAARIDEIALKASCGRVCVCTLGCASLLHSGFGA